MPRLVLTGCLLLLSSAVVSAADPSPEEVVAKLSELTAMATETLGSVTDEKTATAAKATLDELAEQRKELLAKVQKWTSDQTVKVPEKALVTFAKAGEELTLAHDRLFAKRKPAYKALHGSKLFDQIEKPLEEKATAQAQVLQNATKSYMAKNGGKTPGQLLAVANLLEGGGKAILDPWGAPFQYQVVNDQNGYPAAAIWTVSPYSGRKLGFPPAEKKEK